MMQPREIPSVPPKFRTIAIFAALAFMVIACSSCITQRKIYDSQGVLIDKETIIHRPVKDFVDNAKFE